MAVINKLTDKQIKNAKPRTEGGKTLRLVLGDGGGLRVVVDPSGSKSWDFRYVSPVTKKERTIGLGLYPALSLVAVRERAQELRSVVAQGIDPLAEKASRKAAAVKVEEPKMTLERWTRSYISTHEGSWKNPVHRQQWHNTMESYVYPIIGKLAIEAVDTDAVLSVLNQDSKGSTLWGRAPETAMRTRGRLEMVLGAAAAAGLRARDHNPATWRGHLQHLLPKKPRGGHHEALPYSEAPAFWKSLRADTSMASRALQFVTLTATRFSAAVEATMEEVDLEKATWTIPDARLKVQSEDGKGFVVPLPPVAVALIKEQGITSGLVFPSPMGTGALSYTAVLKAGRKHAGRREITTHGFRSTFRDWVNEQTETPFQIAEAALQHAVGNKTTGAYLRGNAPEKRRALMVDWAEYLEGGPGA